MRIFSGNIGKNRTQNCFCFEKRKQTKKKETKKETSKAMRKRRRQKEMMQLKLKRMKVMKVIMRMKVMKAKGTMKETKETKSMPTKRLHMSFTMVHGIMHQMFRGSNNTQTLWHDRTRD